MMIVKCSFMTCDYYKNGICNRIAINLESFDYEDEKKIQCEGLKCSKYKYNKNWMNFRNSIAVKG